MTVIDLLRHGEPQGGMRFRGHGVDDPLSELGWQQMWHAVGDEAPWTRIVSSPMQRCVAFAQAMADRHGIPIEVDERIKEVGFGAWEGRARDEVRSSDIDAFLAFYRDPVNRRPQGAEPLEDFVERVHEALNHILEAMVGDKVLVVAHAGVLRAAVMLALEAPLATLYRMHVPYAGRARLRAVEHGLELDFPPIGSRGS
jgi:probable phosphoglycerate mutase